MKATEQYFPVMLFVTLYKAVLTFESVDEILKCGHANESYCAVISVSFGALVFQYLIFPKEYWTFSRILILGALWNEMLNTV